MKNQISLLVILSVFFFSSKSQMLETGFEASLKNETTLITWDSLHVSYNGEKAGLMTVSIQRSICYKILNKEGLYEVSNLSLPQPIDEMYRPHSSGIRNATRLYTEIKISKISFEMIHDGISSKLVPKLQREQIRVVNDEGLFGEDYLYNYSVEGLDIGDELVVQYSYYFPFPQNWFQLMSTRLFFHGKYPKELMYVDWSYDKHLEVDTNFINLEKPKISTDESKVHYFWTFQNLPGCIDEPGARAHAELPWFSFTPKPYDLLYEHYNTFEQEFIPFWYLFGLLREERIVAELFNNEIGIQNKDHECFQKLADRWTSMAPDDSSGITKLRYFQRYVIDSTRYDNDYNYFINQESYKKDKPGTELLGGVIKEHTKESIYAGMLPKINHTFFTAYTADTRDGYISREYYAPMYDNELLFASILHNKQVAFVLPKSDKRNLFAEELPFYYENAPAILIYASDYAGYKRNFNDLLRISNTPGSTVNDNYRKINSMAKADPEKGIIEFSTRISLSGQYSTLTRNIYTDKQVDSTINPIYLSKVYDLGADLNLINQTFDHVDYYFPFNASVNAVYRISGLISKDGENFELDLQNWIKHVILPDLHTEGRLLNFYSDFAGTDSWAYMISFPEPIEVIEMPDPIEIDNDYGSFKFSVKQMGDKQILVNSYLQVKALFVDKQDISNVSNIYDLVKLADKSVVKFKKPTVQ
ncbi:MAG TPA: hypothetical protein P5514_11225 [Bacteroidales bacterium]|nr:hypothetical protein [Bacteroidales bacterium]